MHHRRQANHDSSYNYGHDIATARFSSATAVTESSAIHTNATRAAALYGDQELPQQLEHCHYDSDGIPIAERKNPSPRRRRRRGVAKSFGSNRRFRSSQSSSSNFVLLNLLSSDNEDAITCLMGLIVVVSFLILVSLVYLYNVMESKGVAAPVAWPKVATFGSKDEKHRSYMMQPSEQEEFPDLPSSPVYTIPHSMSYLGDRSDQYASLRKTIDKIYPYSPERSLRRMEELRKYNISTFLDDSNFREDTENNANPHYDIYNCPDEPPPDYPYEWHTTKLLDNWKPDNTTIPHKIHQGICVFDFRKDYIKALNYRSKEVPFIVKGDPEVAMAVERWNHDGYMKDLMGSTIAHRAEYSETNHFVYWLPERAKRKSKGAPGLVVDPNQEQSRTNPKGWEEPTKMIRMTYPEFISRANFTHDDPDIVEKYFGPDQPHWYYRLIGCGETGPKGTCDAGSSEWLYDELIFFQPKPHQLYLKEPKKQRGIHCRFGMRGVTVANHFDGTRNAIALLGGTRRYILSHPKSCENLVLFPKGHPSARHSAIDWSNPDLDEFPQFAQALSNEVVLQAGDVLYLPTNWFHYIVSLELNFQCNTRSGMSEEYMKPVSQCGFY